ncbi:MAG: 23S rRNA (pseudouridine(1915)-N(3))-methyltransferase RlmH [Pseudomonadota bacterium]|nr:23S rRNA (pseudouridine(1915)-N(3))-methyltransferase RlmH [Pseudomonadota bacterium]
MNIAILAVGRMKKGPEKNLWDFYARRLRWSLILKEVEVKNSFGAEQIKRKEADLLLSKVPKGAFLITMDQKGLALSSVDFANNILDWQDSGINDLAIAIGGSEGLDNVILDKANLSISMGSMTWPHMLARVMLLEQVYRVQCILNGHPYHK